MKIKILASTAGLGKNSALNFSGKLAGICYMSKSIENLMNEDLSKTEKRVERTLNSGHHSVFGHAYFTFIFEGIPKILAMLLNNEKMYNTSEKSARYTELKPSLREESLYQKWLQVFEERIFNLYREFDAKKVKKLAQENARYLIGVFTPTTTMAYTCSFQQFNYIIYWAREYVEKNKENEDIFVQKMTKVLEEFLVALPYIEVKELNTAGKGRKFSLFAKRDRVEEFGENYSVNYLATFAQLAQSQRHRTLAYEMKILDKPQYYVPSIIKNSIYEAEWLKDMDSLKDLFPQGMLVQVNERGTIENFVLKCTERLCGNVQLETMEQTKETMDKYINSVKNKPELYNYLLPYSKGPRCTFPEFKCSDKCIFGPKNAFDRKI